MKQSAIEIKNELGYFTGTEHFYKYMGGLILTDGAKYIADSCGAYWLLDIIFSVQTIKKFREQSFQVFKLKKTEANSAVVTLEDGNDNVLYKQEISFTDFPLEEIILWCVDKTIMLPSEY